MQSAIVIGNGTSRKSYDVRKLVGFPGPVIGCNLTYLEPDFNPDLTVTIDDEAIKAVMAHVPIHRVIIPPKQERWELNGSGRRSNAGMCAIHEAIKRGYRKIYCLGFDSFLKAGADVTTSNVYADNPLYQGPRQATVSDNVFRTSYMDWFASAHEDIAFIFVYPAGLEMLPIADNVSAIDFNEFQRQVGGK